MAKGKSWAKGYRPNRLRGPDRNYLSCPNGRAKCWCCSQYEAVAYKAEAKSPLSDSWDM